MPRPALTLPRSSPTPAEPRNSIMRLPALNPRAPGRLPPTAEPGSVPLPELVMPAVGELAALAAEPAPPTTDPKLPTVPVTRLATLCASALVASSKNVPAIPNTIRFIRYPPPRGTEQTYQQARGQRWAKKRLFVDETELTPAVHVAGASCADGISQRSEAGAEIRMRLHGGRGRRAGAAGE